MIFLERLSEFGLAFINFDYIQTFDYKQQIYIYANNGDSIMDSNGEGLVLFNGIDLSGTKEKNKESGRYEDDEQLGYYYNTYIRESYGDPVYVPESNTPIVTTRTYNDYTKTWTVHTLGGYSPAYTYQQQYKHHTKQNNKYSKRSGVR